MIAQRSQLYGGSAPFATGSSYPDSKFLVTSLAFLATVGLSVLVSFSPTLGLLALMGLAACVCVLRIGWDRSLVWSLLIPWQLLPFIKANILLNPWLWIAIFRLLSKKTHVGGRNCHWSTNVLVFAPPFAYIASAAIFGVDAVSLLYWTIPALAMGASFVLRRPDPEVLRGSLFGVGCMFTLLVIVEFVTDLSFNAFIADVPGVRDYLRGSRALGPAGNPLFSSAVLLVTFFAIPRNLKFGNWVRALFIVAIIMTGSKSAVIGLAVGLPIAVFALGLKRSFGLAFSLLAGVFLLITTLPTAAQALSERYAVFENLQESDPDRAFTTRFVLQSILERPMGGLPIGRVLLEKQLRSPVANGDIFGIESTWLAMASDVGAGVVIVLALVVCWRLLSAFRKWESVALFALFVSLFFWNGFYGAWIIIPLWVCLAFCDPRLPVSKDAPHKVFPATKIRISAPGDL